MQLYSPSSHLILRGDMAHAGRVELTEEERTRLEEMARSRTLAARKVLRAKIILRRANGESGLWTFSPRIDPRNSNDSIDGDSDSIQGPHFFWIRLTASRRFASDSCPGAGFCLRKRIRGPLLRETGGRIDLPWVPCASAPPSILCETRKTDMPCLPRIRGRRGWMSSCGDQSAVGNASQGFSGHPFGRYWAR